MREIKFKIWNSLINSWHRKEAVSLFGETVLMGDMLRDPQDKLLNLSDLEYLIPLQYIGVVDKNGKEIYEGDIIKHQNPYEVYVHKDELVYPDKRYAVCYDEQCFKPKDWYDSDQETGIYSYWNTCEVVGNIYENAGLLIKDNG